MKFQNDYFCFCCVLGITKAENHLNKYPQFIMGVLAQAKNGDKHFGTYWGEGGTQGCSQ